MINLNDSVFANIEPDLADRVLSRREAAMDLGRKVGFAMIASAPVMLGVMAKSAFAQASTLPQSIIDVLNFALKLEYLESEFYKAGLASGAVITATNLNVFQQISKHENAHVAFLQSQLGTSAIAKPVFDFTAHGTYADVMTNPATFLAVSQAFEDTGVRAYKGQAGALQSNATVLTAALQIHSVEARHASEVRRIRGKKGWITGATTDVPGATANYAGEDNTQQGSVNVATLGSVSAATEAFDEPLTMQQVIALVTPFIAG